MILGMCQRGVPGDIDLLLLERVDQRVVVGIEDVIDVQAVSGRSSGGCPRRPSRCQVRKRPRRSGSPAVSAPSPHPRNTPSSSARKPSTRSRGSPMTRDRAMNRPRMVKSPGRRESRSCRSAVGPPETGSHFIGRGEKGKPRTGRDRRADGLSALVHRSLTNQGRSASWRINRQSASTCRRSVGSAPIETRTIHRPSSIAGVR